MACLALQVAAAHTSDGGTTTLRVVTVRDRDLRGVVLPQYLTAAAASLLHSVLVYALYYSTFREGGALAHLCYAVVYCKY